MLEVFPVVNLGTVSLGVAALSYAATLTITVVADAHTYPDVNVLTAGVRTESSGQARTRPDVGEHLRWSDALLATSPDAAGRPVLARHAGGQSSLA